MLSSVSYITIILYLWPFWHFRFTREGFTGAQVRVVKSLNVKTKIRTRLVFRKHSKSVCQFALLNVNYKTKTICGLTLTISNCWFLIYIVKHYHNKSVIRHYIRINNRYYQVLSHIKCIPATIQWLTVWSLPVSFEVECVWHSVCIHGSAITKNEITILFCKF